MSEGESGLTVLVTGGAGFIGSNLVRALLERGEAVRVLDDFSPGRRENLLALEGSVEVFEGDLRDRAACSKACCGVEAVLHQAALGSVPRSVDDPVTSHQVNVTGTLNLLQSALDCGVGRFVFASSSSVYGNSPEAVKTETLVPRPVSPYASTKLAGEAYTLAFKKTYGLNTIALRYFNVFGPRQDPDSAYAAVVPCFASRLLSSESPTIYGDGEQMRDFTFVDNVVSANLLALTCPEEACGEVYNVACGSCFSVNQLFRMMRDHLGVTSFGVEPIHAPSRKGDIRNSLASIDKVRDALGYLPLVGFEDGVRRTMDWYAA